jgi:glucose-1-phosphate thymidylyltransferase
MPGVKGIVLAGGAGSRLHPLTRVVSKQLLPVYDKPMIYYPLSVLMLAGIRDVLVITTPHEQHQFRELLRDGSQWGLSIEYATQPSPDGLPQAFLIGAEFLAGGPAMLILGDNLFFGHGLYDRLRSAVAEVSTHGGCALFGYQVATPEIYGVAILDGDTVVDIEEKPQHPRSDIAVTGLYIYDGEVVEHARALRPSARGELEITDLNRRYIAQRSARLHQLGRGTAWLDTGSHDSLMEAGQFVQVLQRRQGVMIACLEEIALRLDWITPDDVRAEARSMGASPYSDYLHRLAHEFTTAPVSAGAER